MRSMYIKFQISIIFREGEAQIHTESDKIRANIGITTACARHVYSKINKLRAKLFSEAIFTSNEA